MAAFIVEAVGPNGVRTWVVIEAADTGDARTKANQILEQGFIPNISVPADASGVNRLFQESPGFTIKPRPSGLTWPEHILSELGGAVQADTTPPPSFDPPPPPGGGFTDWQKMKAAEEAARLAAEQPNFMWPRAGEGEGLPGQISTIRGGAEAQFGPMFRAGLADRGITLGGGGGIEGRLAEQARNPFFSRSLASTAFGAPSIEGTGQEAWKQAMPAQSFQDMVRGGALYGAGAAQQARDLLTQAQGFGRDFTGRGELAGSILNPGTIEEGTNLANIAREAGRQRYGSFARFLPQAGALSESYFAQPETVGAGAQTFANFLNQKIFGV